MQEEDRDTKELPVDSSRRKLALALLGGFAGASLLEACEEAEPEALKAAGPLADLNEVEQGLTLTTAAYDKATELTTHLGGEAPLLAIAAGLNAPGDGRGGQFYWDPDSEAAIDSQEVFGVVTTPGRWVRLHNLAIFRSVENEHRGPEGHRHHQPGDRHRGDCARIPDAE